MKQLIFVVILGLFINGLTNAEINDHLSSKNSKNVDRLLQQLFPVYKVANEPNTDPNIKSDTELKLDETPFSLLHQPSLSCSTCLEVVKIYEEVFNTSNSASDVQSIFIRTCYALKYDLISECYEFYQTNGLEAIKDILRGACPRNICENLNFCRQDQDNSDSEDNAHAVPVLQVGDRQCRNCVKIVNYYEKVINPDFNLTVLIERLSNTCSVYKTKYQTGCYDYFKNPRVVQFYQAMLDQKCPYPICQNAGLCRQRDEDTTSKTPVSINRLQSRCSGCIFVVKMYEQVFNNSLSPTDIQKVFIGICDIFKEPIRAGCIKFYKTKGLQAIKGILRGFCPSLVCENLNVCGSGKEDAFFNDIFPTLRSLFVGNRECRNCERIVRFYENIVNSSNNLTFVVEKLSAICSVYQTKYQTGCNDYFKNPDVLEFYREILGGKCPNKICRRAGFCYRREKDSKIGEISPEESSFFLPKSNIL